jgi:predicted transcriptional regulator
MQTAPQTLPAQMRVNEAVELARSGQQRTWPVVDKDSFLGMLTRERLEAAFADGRKDEPLLRVVETFHVQHVHMDHPLHLALERMSKYHLDLLPVIHRADMHKLEGVVTMRDVLDAYGVNSVDHG